MKDRPPRVLLAADGSAAARLATHVAARIAAGQDNELLLVHVTAATDHRVAGVAPTMPLTRRVDDPLANPRARRRPDPRLPGRREQRRGAALGRPDRRLLPRESRSPPGSSPASRSAHRALLPPSIDRQCA